jgi:hypothetical protein
VKLVHLYQELEVRVVAEEEAAVHLQPLDQHLPVVKRLLLKLVHRKQQERPLRLLGLKRLLLNKYLHGLYSRNPNFSFSEFKFS